MLDAHLADVKVVVDIKALGKGPAFLTAGGCLNVLVGGEVIHYHGHAALIKDRFKAVGFELVDGHRESNVIAQYQIQFCLDQLSGTHIIHAGVRGQDLLCHGHSHNSQNLQLFLSSYYSSDSSSTILLMPLI